MWDIQTPWFDVAVIMSIFSIGSILFGRFEEHKSRGRRVLKVIIVLAVTVGLATTAGRIWAYGVLAIPLIAAAWAHLYWLPSHGINGWTGEPRGKYLELIRSRQRK